MSHLPPSYNPPPLPPPMPVQAMGVLPYTAPETNARPGVITAIGVVSICIGSIAMIWGLFAGFMTFGLYAASAGWGTPTPVTPDMAGPNGFNAADRTVIVQALHLRQNLTQAQKDQLDWFLADAGVTYFAQVPAPTAGSDVAVDYGDANITASETEVEGGKRNFDLTMGKLTVTDADVSITLKDGTVVTRSATRQMPNPADPSKLSPREVGALVVRIQEMSSLTTPLTAGQVTALGQEIQNNSALLIGSPKDMPAMMKQINSVTNNGGNLYVIFQSGLVSIPATGPTVTTAYNANTVTTNNSPTMLPTPSVILIIESVLSIGLAIYLLVIGIITLRSSPSGARLHKIYAWLKILLTLAGAAALNWLILGGGGDVSWAAFGAVMMLLAGALYPVILLLVLRTKSVREWYTVEHLAA